VSQSDGVFSLHIPHPAFTAMACEATTYPIAMYPQQNNSNNTVEMENSFFLPFNDFQRSLIDVM
jgi:hypothetical protein